MSIKIIDDPGYEPSDRDYYLNFLHRFSRDTKEVVIVSKFHEDDGAAGDKETKIVSEFMNWYLDKHPEEMEKIYIGIIDKLIESNCYTPEPFIPTYGNGLVSLLTADIKSIEKKLEEAIKDKDTECQS